MYDLVLAFCSLASEIFATRIEMFPHRAKDNGHIREEKKRTYTQWRENLKLFQRKTLKMKRMNNRRFSYTLKHTNTHTRTYTCAHLNIYTHAIKHCQIKCALLYYMYIHHTWCICVGVFPCLPYRFDSVDWNWAQYLSLCVYSFVCVCVCSDV